MQDDASSSSLKSVLTTVAKGADISHQLSELAITLFVDCSDDGYLIAERLPAYGSTIGEPALVAYSQIRDEGKRTLLALVIYKVGHKDSKAILLDRVTSEPEARFLPLVVDSLKWDDANFYQDVLIVRAQQIIERGKYGQSFESNRDKDALEAILAYFSKCLPELPKQLEQYKNRVPDFPAEIARYFKKS